MKNPQRKDEFENNPVPTQSALRSFKNMSKAKPSPLPPDTLVGEYRIVRRVAAGGFGVVYLAMGSDGQQVAIKEYLPASLVTRAPGAVIPTVQSDKLSASSTI